MEHWGLITYGEESIAINPATTPATQKLNVASIIAHEIAHHVSEPNTSVNRILAVDYMAPISVIRLMKMGESVID